MMLDIVCLVLKDTPFSETAVSIKTIVIEHRGAHHEMNIERIIELD